MDIYTVPNGMGFCVENGGWYGKKIKQGDKILLEMYHDRGLTNLKDTLDITESLNKKKAPYLEIEPVEEMFILSTGTGTGTGAHDYENYKQFYSKDNEEMFMPTDCVVMANRLIEELSKLGYKGFQEEDGKLKLIYK